MTYNEIFCEIASRMIGGMMFHEQLMNSYLFLGLSGYAKCHEYHYISETEGYIRLSKYVQEHFDRLIKLAKVENPNLIPDSWYGYTRSDVSSSMRIEVIQTSLNQWIEWEEATCYIYKNAYLQLLESKEIDAAEFICEYVRDVSEEIVWAKNEKIQKEAMGYDMASIIEEQQAYEKIFRKKIHKLKGV